MVQLTEEQIAKIKEAVKDLPPEEQEIKARELVAEIAPEALEGQCPFCMMAEGKIETVKVYNDDQMMAVLEINAANPGHILLMPKRHVSMMGELTKEEIENLFKISQVLLKALGKVNEGTNLYISNGAVAGQRFEHFTIHLIPRNKDDKVSFMWEPKKVEQDELTKLQKMIFESIPQEQEEEKIKEEDFEGDLGWRIP